MRWKERLQIALPELVRPDVRSLLVGLPVGEGIYLASNAVIHSSVSPLVFLLGFPSAKLLFWTSDLLNRQRLHAITVRRNGKAYRRGVERIRALRKACYSTGAKGFFPELLRRKNSVLSMEDRHLLDRVEMHACQIEQQFLVLDPFLQQNLFHVLPQVIEQATEAMETGQKLVVLLEFLSKEDPARLEKEERELRTRARGAGVGPMDTLQAQTCRFKSQQIENYRKAEKNVALYRAQIQAVEAGLGNVRGRMASMSTQEHEQIGYEMEALDAELTAIQEGVEMAARATGGGTYIEADFIDRPRSNEKNSVKSSM